MSQCPVCEEGVLKEVQDPIKKVINGITFKIPSVYSECDSCGSVLADKDQVSRNKQAIEDFWVPFGRVTARASCVFDKQRMDVALKSKRFKMPLGLSIKEQKEFILKGRVL